MVSEVALTEEPILEASTADYSFEFQGQKGEIWNYSFEDRMVVEVYPHDGMDNPVLVEAYPMPESIDEFIKSAIKIALSNKKKK